MVLGFRRIFGGNDQHESRQPSELELRSMVGPTRAGTGDVQRSSQANTEVLHSAGIEPPRYEELLSSHIISAPPSLIRDRNEKPRITNNDEVESDLGEPSDGVLTPATLEDGQISRASQRQNDVGQSQQLAFRPAPTAALGSRTAGPSRNRDGSSASRDNIYIMDSKYAVDRKAIQDVDGKTRSIPPGRSGQREDDVRDIQNDYIPREHRYEPAVTARLPQLPRRDTHASVNSIGCDHARCGHRSSCCERREQRRAARDAWRAERHIYREEKRQLRQEKRARRAEHRSARRPHCCH